MRMIKLLGIALILAAAITYGLRVVGPGQQTATATATPTPTSTAVTQNVVVALVDLEPFKTPIADNTVTLKPYPDDIIPPDAVQSKDDVVNRVPTTFIFKDEIVSQRRIVDPLTAGRDMGLSKRVPPGSRAISVEVDKVAGASGFVAQDDIVDVLAVFRNPTSNLRYAKLVLQNIKVLAVGAVIQNQLEQKETSAIQGSLASQTVVLEVKPEEATMIKHLTGIAARYRLVLKNPRDRSVVVTAGCGEADLLGGQQRKTPEQEAREEQAEAGSVRVIRAGSVGSETLSASLAPASGKSGAKGVEAAGSVSGAMGDGVEDMRSRVFE